MKFCAFCGHQLNDKDKFCLMCGEPCIEFIDDINKEEPQDIPEEKPDVEEVKQEAVIDTPVQEETIVEEKPVEEPVDENQEEVYEEQEENANEEEKVEPQENIEEAPIEDEQEEVHDEIVEEPVEEEVVAAEEIVEEKTAEEVPAIESKEEIPAEEVNEEKVEAIEEAEEEAVPEADNSVMEAAELFMTGHESSNEEDSFLAQVVEAEKTNKQEEIEENKVKLFFIPMILLLFSFFSAIIYLLGRRVPLMLLAVASTGTLFVGSIVLLCIKKIGKVTKFFAIIAILISLALAGFIIITMLGTMPGGGN